MVRGLYTATAGMLLQMARQDVVANNLANASTTGFKKDVTVCEAFPSLLIKRMGELQTIRGVEQPVPPRTIGTLGTGAVVANIATDHSTGHWQKTDNPLDLAITGEGYFVVETPAGERYTRDGSFRIDQEGILTTSQGFRVLGAGGYLLIDGEMPDVDENGNVTVGGVLVDVLRVVRFMEPARLAKTGDNLFAAAAGQVAEDIDQPGVLQGYLESSNVNAVQEMVELITVVRAYEANQKVLQAHDQLLDAAINQVATL